MDSRKHNSQAKNAIRRNRRQPFETDSRVIMVTVIGRRFIETIERSIPDADVVTATTSETAYAVHTLSEKRGSVMSSP